MTFVPAKRQGSNLDCSNPHVLSFSVMYYAEIARERMHRDDHHLILRNKKLFCLHLKMKRMLNQKSMLEWMRTKKSCEEEGSVYRVLYVFT